MNAGVSTPIFDNTNTTIGNWNATPQANVSVATSDMYEEILNSLIIEGSSVKLARKLIASGVTTK
ncbi:hypothetical protein D3C86_1934180 [compost metagenome]